MKSLLEAMHNLKEDYDVVQEADKAYRYLKDHFNREICKAVWSTFDIEEKDFWIDNYLEHISEEGDTTRDTASEFKRNNNSWESMIFEYYFEDCEMDPGHGLDELSNGVLAELGKQFNISKTQDDYDKEQNEAREAAIKKLMGTSGLSREEVLEIVNQIK